LVPHCSRYKYLAGWRRLYGDYRENALPERCASFCEDGVENKIPDSPSADDVGITNCLVGGCAVAVTAAAKRQKNWATCIPWYTRNTARGRLSQSAHVYIG
jgi:hypothetical protein